MKRQKQIPSPAESAGFGNDSRSVEWVGFCAAVLAVEIEDAARKGPALHKRGGIIRVSIIHARRMERAVTEAGGNV